MNETDQTEPPETNADCGAMVYHSTLAERIGWRLFPREHIDAPEMPEQGDVFVCETEVRIDWLDRLRILVSGRCQVTTKTATEHRFGNSATVSNFTALPPTYLDPHARPITQDRR